MSDGNNDNVFQKYLQYSTIGFEFVSSVIICLLVGYFVDVRLETKPIGILAGAIVGVGLGLYSFIRNAMKLDKKLSNKSENERK